MLDASEEEKNFITPTMKKTISRVQNNSAHENVDSPFIIPPSPLMRRLGCGTHVTVYKYKRNKGQGVASSPWALKKAKKGRARPHIMERLKVEAEILKSLKHPNIVAFKKLTTNEKGDVCLSMEAFGRGLDDIICSHQEEEELFSAKQIMKVTWSVACALHYLHNTKKLIHGDMKSGNVLVRGDFEQVKVCDFGVSILMKDDLTGPKKDTDCYVGSEPWCAKEVFENGTITDKTDIFAYGLTLWEMLALDVPHVRLINVDESSEDLDGSFITNDISADSLLPDAYLKALGTRPPLPDYEYSEKYEPVIGTFVCCTIEDVMKRPSADDIVKSLATVVSVYDISP